MLGRETCTNIPKIVDEHHKKLSAQKNNRVGWVSGKKHLFTPKLIKTSHIWFVSKDVLSLPMDMLMALPIKDDNRYSVVPDM